MSIFVSLRTISTDLPYITREKSMQTKILTFSLCALLLATAGCKKQSSSEEQAKASPSGAPTAQATTTRGGGQESGPAKFDVCGLIKKEEIQAIEESAVTDAKSSAHSDRGLRVSQCFYTTTEFNRSVVLNVTQADPDSREKRDPKDFWKETFGEYSGEAKEREGDEEKRESLREQGRGKEEEEKSIPPKKIDGVGDEAFWIGNRVGGALYVLRKNAFIRLSIGGPDNEEIKIKKLKALAEKALPRL
jgi:hypothetical protein